MPINPQVASSAISAIGSLFSSGMSIAGASASSHKQYKYAKRLMDRQAKLNYKYGIKGLKESPTAEREGLETAGYNPMLAVQNATSGANSGWTGSQSVQAPDYGSAVSNALDFKRVQNETKTADSNVKLNEASGRKLISESIAQELRNPYISKQEEAQLGRIGAETDKLIRETDYYDQLADNMEAERRLQEMGINLDYNARIYSADKDYKGRVYNADTMKDIADEHSPSGRSQSFNNYMSGIHHGLSGIGDIIHNGHNYTETVEQSYDKHGNIKGVKTKEVHRKRKK